MRALYALTRLFPYWGLVIALASIELALFFRRRRLTVNQIVCWAIAGVFFALIGLWFFNRGDLHSERWVRSWLGV